MAPKYVVELERRYPELTVDSLANAAGIEGRLTTNGRRYLEKLRIVELAKVFDPRRIAVREKNLAEVEKEIAADEADIPTIAHALLVEQAWKRSPCQGGEVNQVQG